MSLIKLWHKKNGSHQTKKYLLPLFTALCAAALFFTGCANSADSIDSSDGKKEKFTITVKTQNIISNKEDEGRSIFPVLSGSEYYTLSYKSGETWQILNGTYPDYQMFIISGTYTLKLDAYSDSKKENHILTGQTKLTVTSGMENAKVLFIMQPPETAAGTGSVSLVLSADTDTQIAAFEITTDSEDLALVWTKDDTETTYTKGTITAASVPSGTYHLTISGKTTAGETVYVRSETLTVWKDLTSSVWIFADGSSSNELKITASDLYSTFYVKGSSDSCNFYKDDVFGDVTASDTNSGNITSPLQTVSAAVNKCVVSGKPYTIYVDGTVKEAIDSTSLDPTAINIFEKIITIKSIKPEGGKSVIQADGNGRIMYAGGTVVLEDLVLKGGGNTNLGGGIYVGHAKVLTMKNCTITDCIATSSGGGLYVPSGSTANLTDCTINGNTASNGAGIHVAGGSVTITDCTFSGNEAQNGGGIYIDNTDAVVTISDSTISENTAQNGGGIYLNNGALTISSTTMESNTATAESTEGDAGVGGGAIYSRKSITFTDCTFLGNDSLKGKAIRFKPMDSEQKLKFNGKIQTNEDDIYFDNGRRFVIQTPLSPDSSILVTPYPCTTGQTILDVEEGVTLAEQVDYFKVTPQVNGSYENQYVVNFNGKILLFQEIEQLTNKPQDNTLVSISTAEGFDKVITWLNTNNLTYITLLLKNDLELAIQIPSNFAGTLDGKGHTITGTNPSYTTLFASPTANFINLKVDGSYTSVKPES